MKKLISSMKEDFKRCEFSSLSNGTIGAMEFILNYPKIENSKMAYFSPIRGFIIEFDSDFVKEYEGKYFELDSVSKYHSFKSFRNALYNKEIKEIDEKEIEKVPKEYIEKAERYKEKFMKFEEDIKKSNNFIPIPICPKKEDMLSRIFRVVYSKVIVNYIYLLTFFTTFNVWKESYVCGNENVDFYWNNSMVLFEFNVGLEKVKYIVANMVDRELEERLSEGKENVS